MLVIEPSIYYICVMNQVMEQLWKFFEVFNLFTGSKALCLIVPQVWVTMRQASFMDLQRKLPKSNVGQLWTINPHRNVSWKVTFWVQNNVKYRNSHKNSGAPKTNIRSLHKKGAPKAQATFMAGGHPWDTPSIQIWV